MTNENNTQFEQKEVNSLESFDDIIFKDFEERLSKIPELEDLDADDIKKNIEQAVLDYHSGIKEAFDYIYLHYEPILKRLAQRRNDDELAQELGIVLYNAVEKFNLSAGVKFNTFFWTCAQNHIGTQKIRRNAQKRSGSKKITNMVMNEETGELEEVVEIVKTKVVSLQSTVNSKDSEVEMGSFVESTTFKNQYQESDLNICLQQLAQSNLLKEKELEAIRLIISGEKLADIGQKLGGITAPAVHVMLRRLGEKKNVRNILKEMLTS